MSASKTVRCLSTVGSNRLREISWFPALDLDRQGKTFPVENPAQPSEILAHVPVQTRSDVTEAIERSDAALVDWRDGTTASFRASKLLKWSKLIQERKLDIATVMTLEAGKTLKESLAEVDYGTSYLDYYAAEAIRPQGTMLPTPFSNPIDGSPKGQCMTIEQAVGVTGLITPWNFPLAMITRKVGPALAAGCTAVIKPSELTPLSAMILQQLAEEAGLEDVVQTITTDREHTPEVGEELCTNSLVRKLSFTGSTAVGKLLMQNSAGTVKRLSLELGGNAPFIVFDDADIEIAVNAAMVSKFRNAGQTCVCADRFLIHSSVYSKFLETFADRIDDIVVGNGMEDEVTMGPLISAQACDKVDQKVRDAIAEGADCLRGGHRLQALGRQFYTPTLLINVPVHAEIWKTETFGPVAAVRSFETEKEALDLANDSSVGLASYFMTKDLSRALRVAKSLETGLVAVNDGIMSSCAAPFGGVKESGLGREGSPVGLKEYTETKYVFVNY